jgi:serine/threonine protein kinase
MNSMAVMAAASNTAASTVGFIFVYLILAALIVFGAIRVRSRRKPSVAPPPTFPPPQRADSRYPTAPAQFQAPPPQYQAPRPQYQAPRPQYQAPRPQYQAPRPQYQAPPPPHQAPPTPAPASTGFTASPVPGQRIAGYRLVEQVGRGGMAMVFRAQDERLGRPVALKILPPELAADGEFRERFARESRAAAALDDPHIIPVYEAGQDGGVLFIAMRYVSGGDVRTALRRSGPMSIARTTSIISPVASALDTAHAAGLLHRDVKPANILIDARPRRPDHVYLSDFGLAKSTTAAPTAASLTGTGVFLGTVDYMSPEQLQAKPVDGRTDQYALACTAFELLAGAPPFRRDDIAAGIAAQIFDPPPTLSALRPDLPPGIDRVFATALAKSPQDRFPGCTDFADALRAVAGLPAYQPETTADPQPHPPTRTA